MKKIVIIDYGIGNVLSVKRAFEHCAAEAIVTNDYRQIANAQALVLPGVGAFEDGMEALRNKGIIEAIERFIITGKPFLGICLGMQMMMDESEEFGHHQGLGLIKGKVKRLSEADIDNHKLRIPFIGWSSLDKCQKESISSNDLLINISKNDKPVLFIKTKLIPSDPLKIEDTGKS
ncbi:MAG: imidazole glycerol-phosphate synthase subunit HisH [Bacteroidales bacterium]|nr:imidazole glycerol-phosphate synthase subunit HisH [Bacteroidales bacterium]